MTISESYQAKADHLMAHYDQELGPNHEAPPAKCSSCDESGFSSFDVYIKHRRMHSNCCYLCGKVVRGSKNYLTHLMTHINGIIYPHQEMQPTLLKSLRNSKSQAELKCFYCGVVYCGGQRMLSHVKTHVLEAFNGTTHCTQCRGSGGEGREFSNVSTYFAHLVEHAKDIRFHCATCDKDFCSDYQLKRHTLDECVDRRVKGKLFTRLCFDTLVEHNLKPCLHV